MSDIRAEIENLPDACLLEIQRLWLMSNRQDWKKLITAQYIETTHLGELKAMASFSRAFDFDKAGKELDFLESLLMKRNGLLFEDSFRPVELASV